MADLSRILFAIQNADPPPYPEDQQRSRQRAGPEKRAFEKEILKELFEISQRFLPRFLDAELRKQGVPPQDSKDLRNECRSTVRDLRSRSVTLPRVLSHLSPIKKNYISLILLSATGTENQSAAIFSLEDFFSFFTDNITVEWLRFEALGHHRQRQENRLSVMREKKRYATIFYRMNEPAFVVDRELRIVDINPAFTDFFGLKRRAVIGQTCCSAIGGKFCVECPLEEMIKSGGTFTNIEIDLTVPAQHGAKNEIRTVSVAGSSLGDIEGVGTGGIVIIQDITGHKLFEIALRESEEKYRSLIENLPDVSWRADRSGCLLFASPNIEKVCDLEKEQLVGRNRFERVHPDDIDTVRSAYEELFASGVNFDIKYRFMREDGSLIWMHDRAYKVIENHEGVIADGLMRDVSELKILEEELEDYRCWLEDLVDERTEEIMAANEKLMIEISERKHVEMELIRMTASLKRSNAELEQFAHVASHDLKEPLMLVTAFAEKLSHRYGNILDSRGREYLERIIKAVNQLQELVDALLDLSRISTSSRVFEPLDMDGLVGDVVAGLEETIHLSGATIETEKLHRLNGDPVQIRQLFQNIIANAIKYRRKEVPLTVNIRSRIIDNDICEITIVDNGIGFGHDHIEKIFDPFVRLHGRGKYEGSGMGLSTCKKIVLRHGGDISARNNDEGGAAFIIRLPIEHHTKNPPP